jgi:hypothetical protein
MSSVLTETAEDVLLREVGQGPVNVADLIETARVQGLSRPDVEIAMYTMLSAGRVRLDGQYRLTLPD